MSNTHSLPPIHSDHPSHPAASSEHRSSGIGRLMQFWLSTLTTGFVAGIMLILVVRLYAYEDNGSTNDQIVQILAIAFACTLMAASMAWNRFAWRAMPKGMGTAAILGACVSMAVSVVVSIETMRRPMDLVVISNPRGDQVVQPVFTNP